jgi:hypothetical protein
MNVKDYSAMNLVSLVYIIKEKNALILNALNCFNLSKITVKINVKEAKIILVKIKIS